MITRRFFTTSVTRFHQPPAASSQPTLVRCSQILHTRTSAYEGREVKVQGFIRSVRKQKRFAFAEISDGSTLKPLQAILEPTQAANLTTGAAVEISGLWKACPPGKEQTHELQTTSVRVLGASDPGTYPIQKKYHTPDFLRQIPHLRLRTPFNSLLSRFRSECIYQLGQLFKDCPNGEFFQVQPPLITSSDCEGAGETFTILPREILGHNSITEHFFRAPKYLTVSSQLHLEAYAAELGNVWALSPVFRAEKSDTPRHLSEFYMLEAEVNFMDNLKSLTDLVEYIIRDLTRRLYNTPVGQKIVSAKGSDAQQSGRGSFQDSVSSLRQRWLDLMNSPKWDQIKYTRAIEILQNAASEDGASFEHPPTWAGGLQLEHEKYLVEKVFQNRPVFVTDYPKFVKPFYMAPSQVNASAADGTSSGENNETVACFDLLMPEISEVAGGSLREHRLENIIQNMRQHGLIRARSFDAKNEPLASSLPPDVPPSDLVSEESNYPHLLPHEDLGHLRWYADLRRWGTAPHGGFGIGFDRLLGYLAGISSVRDVVPFPRYFGRAEC